MAITHDPGPDGPSGEGEFVLTCIFLSYFVSLFLILYKRFKQYKPMVDDEVTIEVITIECDDVPSRTRRVPSLYKISLFVGVWFLLWLFLVCLGLMGNGFKLLGGKDAAKMFDVVDNPISALMIGILSTVLVQSSSTTTSIIVGLVGSDEMSLNNAIPMIFGANIGTSVTNTLVSLSHFGNIEELRLGFAAATIHDCFNMLTVVVLLPIQIATHMFNHLTYAIAKNAKACDDFETTCDKQEFIKPYIKPYYNNVAKYDKKVAYYVSQNFCKGRCNDDENLPLQKTITNMICIPECDSSWLKDSVLKSTRLPAYVQLKNNGSYVESYLHCPLYTNCNVPEYNSTIEPIDGFFTVCKDMEYDLCDKRLLNGGLFYRYWNLSDNTVGFLCVLFSLTGICAVLYLMVQSLHILIKGSIASWFRTAVAYNGYISIIIGMFITIMVQSSSITTSVLTPLVAIGLIPLHDMLPLTLGANIGTTITGILAATVVTTNPVTAWQVALSHLLFNVFGIIIWYPLEKTRNVPLRMATYLGNQTAKNRMFPLMYTVTTFIIIPGIIYCILLI